MDKYWEIKLAAEKVGELLLYGPIANSEIWGDEVTPKKIDAELKALGELDVLNVHINSQGGNVFAAQAIYSIIKRNSAKGKCAYIDGLAASAASLIFCACDTVRAFSNAMIMVHKPWGVVIGNADLMHERAAILDKNEESMIAAYQEKTGLSKGEIQEMLSAETWLTAQEAKDKGFIDEIEEGMQVAASLEGDVFVCGDIRVDLNRFKNPAKVKEVYREAVKPPEPVADSSKEPPEPDPNKEPETKRDDPPEDGAALAEQAKKHRELRHKLYKVYEEEK